MPRNIILSAAVKRIRYFYFIHQRPPSYEEIRELFGYKSKNAAYWLVNKLIDHKVMKKDKQGKILANSLHGIKLLGNIQAGWPSPAEEELIDTMSLDEFMIKHPEQTYLVKVVGDSMIEAGIHENDLVLVERGREAKNGDIVIAQVDGAWTMKYFEKIGQKVKLIAANKKYSPILPKEELTIGGVVVGCIRKYK